jgi:hypothetical protein
VGRLLELGVGEEVVLNPELRAGLFQEGINGHARGTCLGGIEFERGYAIERTLLGINDRDRRTPERARSWAISGIRPGDRGCAREPI